MYNTTTIGPSLHTPLVFGFYSDIKRMTFIQDIAVFQRFLAQLNYKLERIKNLISYIGTHIISLRIKFISSNEIFNKDLKTKINDQSVEDAKQGLYDIAS